MLVCVCSHGGWREGEVHAFVFFDSTNKNDRPFGLTHNAVK